MNQRQQYVVTLRGESREVYIIEAESVEEATEHWSEGYLEVQECYGMEVESVRKDDEA